LSFKPARDARRLRTRLIYTITVHSASGKTERTNGSYIFRRQERLSIIRLVFWALFVFVMTRWLMLGVSIPQQWAEIRAAFEYVVQLLTTR
jgi:hypothetical protein